MATLAHVAYCFETLDSSLHRRQPLTLKEVEQFWERYTAESAEEDLEGEDDVSEEDEEVLDEDMDDALEQQTLKPPAISRLTAASPSSASTSTSSSSDPSVASSKSSVPTPASSKSSSRTSFFSLGRRSKNTSSEAPAPVNAHPLFVTWNTISKYGSKSLRGCIGTFDAQELSDGLRSYALTAAFDDTRFSPIASRELPSLECGVTLLTNFQPAESPMAWELGKHGLRISFTYHGRRYGATYLPDVAREQGWTKEETIVSLMRKAGWSGRRDDWRKIDLSVITYEGAKQTMRFQEWREWRDWVEEQGVLKAPLN